MSKKLPYILLLLITISSSSLLAQEVQPKQTNMENFGELQISEAKEKAQKFTSKIDSLQDMITDNLPLDKINKSKILVTEATNQLKVPGLENELPVLDKLSLPQLPDINKQLPSIGNVSLPNGGISAVTSKVNEQLGRIGNINDVDWIKEDLPDYQDISKEVDQYRELLNDPSNIDQAVNAKAAQLSEFQALNNETKELAAMKELPESMLADLKRFQDQEALKAEAKSKVIEKATNYFAGHEGKLSGAKGTLSKLKKKYSYIPDSRDLSTAIKANSLKREPLKKRFVPGLGFQLNRTNPITLDLSPNLLFRFNKLLSAGLSGIYRVNLGIENNSSVSQNSVEDVYGGSAIAQHKFWKGFFVHAEFHYISTPQIDPSNGSDLSNRIWNEGLPMGIGKQINFSDGLRGQVIFTYDFLHDQYSPNPKAWNIKFGFQFGKIRLKDIRI